MIDIILIYISKPTNKALLAKRPYLLLVDYNRIKAEPLSLIPSPYPVTSGHVCLVYINSHTKVPEITTKQTVSYPNH